MGAGDWKDLVKAADEGDDELVALRLRQGIDPNYQHPEFFTAPIFGAIRAGHRSTVQLLVEQGGANPNLAEDSSGDRPVEVALECGEFEIVDYLQTVLPRDQRLNLHTVLVTGGNRGIGKAIAQELLTQGHRVVVTVRSEEKGLALVHGLIASTKNSKVDFCVGDLGSIASTYQLAQSIKTKLPTMDRLVLNAGIWPSEKVMNEDGLEMSFMVNYVAQYILCHELLPILSRSRNQPSRIVLVSGGIYQKGQADILRTPTGQDFSKIWTYAHTKECAVFLLAHFSRYLPAGVTMNAVHPGVIRTDLGKMSGVLGCLLNCFKRTWKDTQYGARAPVYLTIDPAFDTINGAYYNEMAPMNLTEAVLDERMQEQWDAWTKDLLARERKK